MSDSVYLFWDNSNIFIPAKYASHTRDGLLLDSQIRIEFDNLYILALAGRSLARGICVGSVPPELERVWSRLRRTGVDVELYERGAQGGKEQAVDQALQVHMLRALADSDPAVAVLLTGDGAGYDEGAGFHADLERMAKRGWGVEVLAWDSACSSRLKEWAQEFGVYIPLESHYDSVTFIQGGRTSTPVSLRRRRTATVSELPLTNSDDRQT